MLPTTTGSPSKPHIRCGVHTPHFLLASIVDTVLWRSQAECYWQTLSPARGFDHEMYRATRLSTNERMLVDWPDRTQAGRNEGARSGLGSSNKIPAIGLVRQSVGAWR
jgi:hypothetical protein